MPKMKCICGNIIKLNDIPNPNELLMISETDYDKYDGFIDSEKLYMEMKTVVKCDNCYRLYIYENGIDEDPIIYQLEVGEWNK